MKIIEQHREWPDDDDEGFILSEFSDVDEDGEFAFIIITTTRLLSNAILQHLSRPKKIAFCQADGDECVTIEGFHAFIMCTLN